ncbi:MAG: hypothetical protein ACFFF4_02260 [Candidatus Thorarchaeota archaeon]
MSGHCRNRAVIPITIIMIVSSLIMVQGGTDFTGGLYASEYSDPETYTFVLTDETPSFEINITRQAYKVVIKDFFTNSTPVCIIATSEEETILYMTNITRIVGDTVAVNIYDRENFLNFVRQGADAEVTFVVESWFIVYIAIDVMLMPPFYLFGVALFVICGFLLLNIEHECRAYRGQNRWRRQDGPVSIVVLVLISALLAMPLIYGSTHNTFVLRHLSDSETYEYDYILNDESPEVVLNLLDLLPDNYYSVEIRVEDLWAEEPVRIRTWDNSQYRAYITSVQSFSDSYIGVTIENETILNIDFRRIENNTMLTFDITIEWVYLGRLSDPTTPNLLAIFAFVPAGIALIQAIDVTKILNRLANQEHASQNQD